MKPIITPILGPVFGLASLLCFAPQAVAIEDSLSLFAPAALTVEFDPFSGMPGLQTAALEFTYPDPTPRTVRVIITPEIVPDFTFDITGQPVEFKIESSSGVQSAGQFEAVMNLQPGQVNMLDLVFKVLAGQYADAGNLRINLIINVEDVTTGATLISDKHLHLECMVPSRSQINFAGTTPGFDNGIGIATLDFGSIVFGDSRQVNFQIRGNSDAIVEMTSENNGFLVNEQNVNISPIPYVVDADGVTSDMSTPLSFMRRPVPSLNGSSYPLIVTIAEPEGGAFAGQYRDVISIDVTPQ